MGQLLNNIHVGTDIQRFIQQTQNPSFSPPQSVAFVEHTTVRNFLNMVIIYIYC